MNLNQFDVLVTDVIKAEDKEKILAGVVNIKSPDSKLGENFSIKYLDHYGRVVVVMYRGIEVLLLFKRAVTKITSTDLSIPPLKNYNDAWMSIRLMDAYPGMSLSERIIALENKVIERDKMIQSYEQQLLDVDNLAFDLMQQQRRKAPKTKPGPAPIPMACAEVNGYLKLIKPIKLNTLVREYFLWSQGFDLQLNSPVAQAPDIPPKLKVRLFKKMKKIDKWMKVAKRERQLEPYIHVKPPQKIKKAKAAKSAKAKTTKKKIVKKKKP